MNAEGTAHPPDAVVKALAENQRAFLRFLERRVESHDTAAELLQDAFARATSAAEGLRDDESAVAWFYRILRNAVVDHYRRQDAARRALEAFARELDEVVPASEIHDQVCACIGRLARSLKPEYAEALLEVEVEGRALRDYAEKRGITANNAAVRIYRARQALKKQVVASCGICAAHGCMDCRCRQNRAEIPRP
jgi:RNA polymerase sigma factor (sigma-70 family)